MDITLFGLVVMALMMLIGSLLPCQWYYTLAVISAAFLACAVKIWWEWRRGRW